MSDYSGRASLHGAVIVVWNESDPDIPDYESTLKNRLTATFKAQWTREEVFFRPAVRSSGELETALADTLIRLQDRIIQDQKASVFLEENAFRRKPELGNTPIPVS
ncbi:MAG: hypothetical protein H7Y20_08500 [Bryobacteraceae bacterium]|nr:hypothetical protein [Bryobacteraceae bacterium]